jgi:adenylate cyclase
MDAKNAERRLAAILSADAVGYSRLMARDEAETVATLKSHRQTLGGLVRQHGGRVVDAPGDNLLAELPSVVDAVSCAIAAQRELERRSQAQPEERRLRFRIGIHVGDVIVDGKGIYGDSINIAARLESLAEAGGICVSGTVHQQVLGKLPATYEDLGEQQLKNIAQPVRALRVRPARTSDSQLTVPGFGEHPAIAVLAFDNLSGDAEQEYFADGIAEDLITRLSAHRIFPVIARNSSFVYKGRAVDVKQVSRELGARYVVEGSVRRAGARVRVSAQLIDATTGHHVWAERFDREFGDLFALQDEITETIVAQLEPELGKVEQARVAGRRPENLDAWECVQRAYFHLGQPLSDDPSKEHKRAQGFLKRAIELDPRSGQAYALLAFTEYGSLVYQWSENPARSLADCLKYAQRSVELDDAFGLAHSVLGLVNAATGQVERAIASAKRGIELDPSSALALLALGAACVFSNRPEEALPMIEKAMRLSPRDPFLSTMHFTLGLAHLLADRYAEARTCALRSLELRKDPTAYRLLAAACGHLNHGDEAKAALEEMQRLTPDFSVEGLRVILSQDIVKRYLAGWRKAGWEG